MIGTLTAGQCKFFLFIRQMKPLTLFTVAIYGDIKRVLGATGGVEIGKASH